MIKIKKGDIISTVPNGAYEAIYKRLGWKPVGNSVADVKEPISVMEEETEEEAEEVAVINSFSGEDMPDEIAEILKIEPKEMSKEQVAIICDFFDIDVAGKKKSEIIQLLNELVENLK